METTQKLTKLKNLTGQYTNDQIKTANLFGCRPEQVATSLDEIQNCEYFCGNITLNGLTNLDTVYTNNLKAINGNLVIMNCNLDVINNLKLVTGYVQILSSKIKYINDLLGVGGNLSLTNSVIIAMPHLKVVGGNLLMQKSDVLNFNELDKVVYNVYLMDSYVGSAKKINSIGGICMCENSKIDVLPNHKIACQNITVIDEKRNITHKFCDFYAPSSEQTN